MLKNFIICMYSSSDSNDQIKDDVTAWHVQWLLRRTALTLAARTQAKS
jgi:hypothetical protein